MNEEIIYLTWSLKYMWHSLNYVTDVMLLLSRKELYGIKNNVTFLVNKQKIFFEVYTSQMSWIYRTNRSKSKLV